MTPNEALLIEAARKILPTGYKVVPATPLPVQRWPFVESPRDFAKRLHEAANGPGSVLAGVRTVLIEEPPALHPEYISMLTW